MDGLRKLGAEIERDMPARDASSSLLRDEMIQALLRWKPRTKEEWLSRIPLELRLDSDGTQVQSYLHRVLDLTSHLKQ